MPTSSDSPTPGELSTHLPHSIPVETPEADEELPAPSLPSSEDDVRANGASGEIWAIWEGAQPGERGLLVEDLRSLGDKEATEPIWWNPANRWTVEITGLHPMVIKYLEQDDDDFKIVRL
jgi:hypothetical protein